MAGDIAKNRAPPESFDRLCTSFRVTIVVHAWASRFFFWLLSPQVSDEFRGKLQKRMCEIHLINALKSDSPRGVSLNTFCTRSKLEMLYSTYAISWYSCPRLARRVLQLNWMVNKSPQEGKEKTHAPRFVRSALSKSMAHWRKTSRAQQLAFWADW